MRPCVHCKNDLRRHPLESHKQFAKRRYCDRECVIAERRAKMPVFKDSGGTVIRDRARVLGNGHMVRNALLNAEKVKAIRELNNPLGFNAREIGEHMGVGTAVIQKVLNGETYRHVV